MYFRNSLFDIICEISLFVTAANQETIARNLCEFGVAHSEEMEVNQWIHWISRLWVAIIRAHEKHYPLFKHILKWSAVSHKMLIESWLLGISNCSLRILNSALMIFDHLGLSNFEKNSGIEVVSKTLKQLLKFIYSNIYLFISIY